jgi:hypothetical protein
MAHAQAVKSRAGTHKMWRRIIEKDWFIWLMIGIIGLPVIVMGIAVYGPSILYYFSDHFRRNFH